jgi:hypothetical protein
MAKTKTKVSKDTYVATVRIMGKTYESKGESVRDALTKLSIQGTPRGIILLTISCGDKSRQKILNGVQTSRLFSPSKIAREIALKAVCSLFDL